MNSELVNKACLGCADVDMTKFVFGSNKTLRIFADFSSALAQLIRHFGSHVVVNLDNLQLGFCHLAFGLRSRRDQISKFAIKIGRFPLQRIDAGGGYHTLVKQRL
jgi:hypothetical protein